MILHEGVMNELKESIQNFKSDLLLCSRVDLPPYMKSFVLFKERLLIAVPKDHLINEKAVQEEGKALPSLDLFWLNGEKSYHGKNQSEYPKGCRLFFKCKWNQARKNKRDRCIETAMQMVREGLGIGFNREVMLCI